MCIILVYIDTRVHLYKLGHKQVNNVSVRLMDICASYDERMIHAMLLATHVHACAIVHMRMQKKHIDASFDVVNNPFSYDAHSFLFLGPENPKNRECTNGFIKEAPHPLRFETT